MFANDTHFTVEGKSQEDIQIKLNGDLQHIHSWLLANKLTLNIDKSEYMIVGSRQRLSNIIDNPVISIGEQNIKRVTTSKSLGVIIDEILS